MNGLVRKNRGQVLHTAEAKAASGAIDSPREASGLLETPSFPGASAGESLAEIACRMNPHQAQLVRDDIDAVIVVLIREVL